MIKRLKRLLSSMRPARIIHLFFLRRPLAIGGFIIAVVIDPLYRMFSGWLEPHICKKILELEPSVANGNSAPTVIDISRRFFIAASMKHSRPRIIFWRMATFCMAMFRGIESESCKIFNPFGYHQASAALSLASYKERADHNTLRSATARTQPASLFILRRPMSSDHSKEPEWHPAQIFDVSMHHYILT